MRSRPAILLFLAVAVPTLVVDEQPLSASPRSRVRKQRARSAARAQARPAPRPRSDRSDRSPAPVPRTSIITVETPLFERPGESTRRLARLARGTPVELLARSGRWIEARAGGVRGWIPRSTVELAGPAEPAAGGFAAGEVRAGESRKAVWMGPATLVHAVRAGSARARPEPGAAAVFDVEAGAELRAAGQKRGEWLLVENSVGVVGWIPSSALDASAQGSDPGEASAVTADAPAPGPATRGPSRSAEWLSRSRWIRASAALGVSSLTTEFSSNGTSPLSGYRLSASAMAAFTALEAGLAIGRLRAALDGGYGVTLGLPGIRARDGEGGALDPVGFSWHHFTGGARLGYLVGDAVAPYARAGYHFDWFRVDDVTNPGKLARDGLSGVTAGLGVEGALGADLLIRAAGDALIAGRRTQTPGLQDGRRSSALAAWARLEVSYLTGPALAIEGAYQYGWASTEWNGQSTRQADVTEALRTDRTHLLLLALRRDF